MPAASESNVISAPMELQDASNLMNQIIYRDSNGELFKSTTTPFNPSNIDVPMEPIVESTVVADLHEREESFLNKLPNSSSITVVAAVATAFIAAAIVGLLVVKLRARSLRLQSQKQNSDPVHITSDSIKLTKYNEQLSSFSRRLTSASIPRRVSYIREHNSRTGKRVLNSLQLERSRKEQEFSQSNIERRASSPVIGSSPQTGISAEVEKPISHEPSDFIAEESASTASSMLSIASVNNFQSSNESIKDQQQDIYE